ncbi:MAG: ABC transporter ATP-binding protein [Actinomycetales bacterium]|nr:ABC transporter ATP-binding protein [Actinomycetales bacterium]
MTFAAAPSLTHSSISAPPTQADEPAILLADVWVQYRLRHAHHYNLKRALATMLARRSEQAEVITALAGVTLQIPAGSRIGLSGPNGAGKSTLLAVMSGALVPSSGSTRTRGRVLALLGGPNEGLDPEQTGRENAISLGIRYGEGGAAMAERVDQIADFSGLGRRFDHPVYSYSTGMQVRLRFSTITAIGADVLLVDEGFGTTDAEFNERAAARLAEFYAASGTLVLSSHDEGLLAQHCDQFLRLAAGQVTPAS